MLAFLSVPPLKIQETVPTPQKLSKSTPAFRRKTQRIDLVNLGGCGGVRIWRLRYRVEPLMELLPEILWTNLRNVQKSMGHKVPWRIGMLTCHPVVSRLIFAVERSSFISWNFATTYFTAFIVHVQTSSATTCGSQISQIKNATSLKAVS